MVNYLTDNFTFDIPWSGMDIQENALDASPLSDIKVPKIPQNLVIIKYLTPSANLIAKSSIIALQKCNIVLLCT